MHVTSNALSIVDANRLNLVSSKRFTNEMEIGNCIDCVPKWAWLQVAVTSWARHRYSDDIT